MLKQKQKQKLVRERRSRWWSRRMCSSPPTTNISKMHLYWRHSHWKQTGDWQKDSCKTKVVRKIHTESGRKGREAIRLGPLSLGGNTEGKGNYMGLEILSPWGVRCLSHILDTPGLGSNTRKTSPLSWFGNQWNWQEGCKKHRLCSWRMCTHVLPPKTRRRKKTETAWDSGQFPETTPPHGPTWADCWLWPHLVCGTSPR